MAMRRRILILITARRVSPLSPTLTLPYSLRDLAKTPAGLAVAVAVAVVVVVVVVLVVVDIVIMVVILSVLGEPSFSALRG